MLLQSAGEIAALGRARRVCTAQCVICAVRVGRVGGRFAFGLSAWSSPGRGLLWCLGAGGRRTSVDGRGVLVSSCGDPCAGRRRFYTFSRTVRGPSLSVCSTNQRTCIMIAHRMDRPPITSPHSAFKNTLDCHRARAASTPASASSGHHPSRSPYTKSELLPRRSQMPSCPLKTCPTTLLSLFAALSRHWNPRHGTIHFVWRKREETAPARLPSLSLSPARVRPHVTVTAAVGRPPPHIVQ